MADKNENGNRRRSHLLVVTYPVQGHINPMLQFSKRLHHKGAAVTFVVTNFLFNTKPAGAALPPFPIETISDGYDGGGIVSAESIEAYLDRFERVGSETLRDLLRRLSFSGEPVDGVVYDGFMPWVLDVAKEFGLMGALYFTQSCFVDNIYFHVYRGDIEVPLPVPEKEIVLPGLPPLLPSDLPSLVYNSESYPAFFDMLVNQFRNIEKADWVICNTFYELEEEVVDWMRKKWSIKTIGPNVPSNYMDGRIEDDREYGFSLFKSEGEVCMKWLDRFPKASVVYVSFGSLAALNLHQMEELAWALRLTNSYFLWVVRETEAEKLPENFVEETVDKGLVVSWCSQLDVLSHDAIGCFVTHCGWNSTLEALSLGVPMVAIPQWSDQSTNAKCVMDIWKSGIKAPADDTGIVRRDAVVNCIKVIMEGERGNEIKRNAAKWGVLAKQAVDDGGSSDKNIDEILADLSLALK
uniref:Glycosyltransferase n=1 Tax=Gynostemma pentaphyllum TaxID=182084 RepID=A0A8F2JDH7_GYNPE|nr:UGT74F2 [Gynostemma pentaphyllum]